MEPKEPKKKIVERKKLPVKEIAERFAQGETIRELAKRFKVTHVTIIRRLRTVGTVDGAVVRIQKASGLNRKAALLLLKRCNGNVAQALHVLRENERQAEEVKLLKRLNQPKRAT